MSQPNRSTVTVRGFSRMGFALILLLTSLLIAAFMHRTAGPEHGLYAICVLLFATLMLMAMGGPAHQAQRIQLDAATIDIFRFTRIRSQLATDELVSVDVTEKPVALVLEPRDPREFFRIHPEFQSVRRDDRAYVPAGRDRRTAAELGKAITAAGLTRPQAAQ